MIAKRGKTMWLITTYGSGEEFFDTEIFVGTETETAERLLSKIHHIKELVVNEWCDTYDFGTESIDDIASTSTDLSGYLNFVNSHIEIVARKLDSIPVITA